MSLRIVVRSPNWIGDHILALPFYRALRDRYPESHLTLLRPESMEGLDFSDLFDQILVLAKTERRGWRGARSLAKRLAVEPFDLAFSLASSFSAALPLFLAGIPCRVGFDASGSYLLWTDSLRWAKNRSGKHKSRLYLELLEYASGHEVTPMVAPLKTAGQREKLIVVAPGASIALRQWPYHRELLPKLRARYPEHRIVVVGSTAEKPWSEVVKALGDPKIEDEIGKTSLPGLVEICQSASLVITNDSGVAHLSGTLAEAPTLVLFGPGDPTYISPLGPRVYGLRWESLACSPCEKSYCRAPYGHQACLKGLSAEQVLERSIAILG